LGEAGDQSAGGRSHPREYQNLEYVAEDKVYKFAYILGVDKIRGAAAGTVLRPIGIV